MSWQLDTTVSDEQVNFYKENGYLTFGRIFTETELNELREYVDRMIENLPEGKRPEQMDVPHFEHPYLFKFLTHPRVLNVIARFIGPDILLWSSHFISKRENDGMEVPWHQDGVYWGKMLEPMHVITMWLAVDESKVENGCMRVIPGSHTQQDRRYEPVKRDNNLFGSEVVDEDIDTSKAVDLELEVGACHFHDAWTIHNSSPNVSQKRRCGYTMRYMPANVRFHGANWQRTHDIYLVQGQDRTDGYNRYAPVPNPHD